MSTPNSSPSSLAWSRFRRHPLGFPCALIVLGIIAACFLGPFISPFDYADQDLANTLQAPTLAHWFGTDNLGRDLLVRTLVGGRISFIVALAASCVSILIGLPYGILSGWKGGRVDLLMMRFIDIVYALPFTIFVILLMVLVGRGIFPLLLAIGAVEWLSMARIIRGQTLTLRNMPFVEASHTIGLPTPKIMTKHLIPNILPTAAIAITVTLPSIILMESFVSFLGLGVQAPMTSWGDLINTGAQYMHIAPWMLIFPSILFAGSLFCMNQVGDALRDALDPKS